MNRIGKLVTLEGVCCSGKTTLCGQLSRRLKSGVVPELPAFARNLFLSSRDAPSLIHNSHLSIALEGIRMSTASALRELAGHVVLDRGILSVLALHFGAIDIIGATSYLDLSQAVRQALCDGIVAMPDVVICLAIEGSSVIQRNAKRNPPLPDYWVHPDRIGRQNEFYRHISRASGVRLVDASRDAEDLLAECLEIVQTPSRCCIREIVHIIEIFDARVN